MKKTKLLLLSTIFMFLTTGSSGQNNKAAMTTYQDNDCIVDSITMKYRNENKYKEILGDRDPFSLTLEELNQQYDNYTIDKKDWDLIIEIVQTAVYDEGQYDEMKNPNGYMLKIAEQNYTITIYCSNGKKNTIAFWINRMSINGKWYAMPPAKRGELNEMVSKYTKIER